MVGHNRADGDIGCMADVERLHDILKVVADKIGEVPAMLDTDGNIFVHPDLEKELQKPEDEGLSDLLRIAMKGEF